MTSTASTRAAWKRAASNKAASKTAAWKRAALTSTASTRAAWKRAALNQAASKTPNPQKVPKKVGKDSQKRVKINNDFDYLFRPFSELLGGSGSGVPNSSRETFSRLFGVSGSVDGRRDPNNFREFEGDIRKCRKFPVFHVYLMGFT